jgi:hypothetical protein
MLPSSTARVIKMDEKLPERVDDVDWRFASLEAFFKEERRQNEVLVREDGIATRRHMDVVAERITAELKVTMDRVFPKG